MSKGTRTRRGFALSDLLACVAAAAVLLSGLLAVGLARDRSRSGYCKSNISAIGKALAIYTGATKDGAWPWLQTANRWDAPTGEDREKGPSAEINRNVSALLFMLVRDGQTPGIFVCPATDDIRDPSTKKGNSFCWDFSPYKDGNAEHVSYSYQAPLCAPRPTDANRLDLSSGVTNDANGGLIVLADRTPAYDGLAATFNWNDPGKADPKTGMSQNHAGGTINLLYADLHVGQSAVQADCGIGRDNIYSAAGLGANGKPLAVQPGAGSERLTDHLSPDDSFLEGPKKMEK